MKQLQFRFQRIFELKERIEDFRKAALGEAVAAMEGERQELRELEVTSRMYSEVGPPGSGPVDADLLAVGSQHGLRLEREKEEQRELVRLADTVVSEKRGDLLAATKERRVFETLRERAAEAHRSEQRRQERIWLDEVGQQIHSRKRNVARLDS